MGLWVVYVLLGLAAGLLIAFPLFRRAAPAPASAEAAGAAPAPAKPPTALRRWGLPVGGAVVVVAASVALYMMTGEGPAAAPGMAGPLGAASSGASLPDVDTMIGRLAKRLEAAPDDPEGWRMLGWSYFATGRYPEAVKAYGKAVALRPKDAAFQAAYGEALVKAGGDKVDGRAQAAFRAALAADPNETRARVYMARLKHEQGRSAEALDALFAILDATPADSPLQPTIREAIGKVAAESGIDVSGRLPQATASGPSPADIAAAQQMAPGDQQAMIDGMVERLQARLEASPRDVDGWIMLMRSRKRLGQDGLALEARDKALKVFADDAAATAKLRSAAKDLGVG